MRPFDPNVRRFIMGIHVVTVKTEQVTGGSQSRGYKFEQKIISARSPKLVSPRRPLTNPRNPCHPWSFFSGFRKHWCSFVSIRGQKETRFCKNKASQFRLL